MTNPDPGRIQKRAQAMAGKHILLVGASGGIGTQLAAMFPNDFLALHYYQHELGQQGERPGSNPAHPRGFAADITKYEQVERMVTEVLREFGRIDVTINCAGISLDAMAHKFTPDDWQNVIQTNLIGAFNVIRAVLPSMRTNKYGRIINMSSVVFQRPVLGTTAYSASKAGLVGLTRTVALENAHLGITCNCIALGYFEAGLLYRIPLEMREAIRRAIPIGRFGQVEEIQRTIQYLIDTEYITGQVVNLNGGLYTG